MVVAALCVLLGVIYAYIYVTRINPKFTRVRRTNVEHMEDDGTGAVHTHVLFFR
jgi:uncharacterized membrane protein (DUF485 family)